MLLLRLDVTICPKESNTNKLKIHMVMQRVQALVALFTVHG